MNNLVKAGIGCGCLPAVLLMLGCAGCFVLVAAGAINYSEEENVMIAGALLGAGGLLFAIPGVVLLLGGIMQSRQRHSPGASGS